MVEQAMHDHGTSRAASRVCPIPRCALEWGLVAMTVFVALGMLTSPLGLQMQEWLHGLPEPARVLTQPGWAAMLFAAAAWQAFTILHTGSPQHLGALFTAMVWMAVTVMVFKAGLYLIGFVGIGMTLGELYVAFMLKP